MAFIGIPYYACNTQMFDLQVGGARRTNKQKLRIKTLFSGPFRFEISIGK